MESDLRSTIYWAGEGFPTSSRPSSYRSPGDHQSLSQVMEITCMLREGGWRKSGKESMLGPTLPL
eukprot:6600883-Pyramimonas_sp.AAC.1